MSPDGRALLDDPGFVEVKARVIDATGLAYYSERDRELAKHIAADLQDSGHADLQAYLGGLDRVALQRLVKRLTIGETYFFRHPEVFDGLTDVVVPDILERNRSTRTLRVWSAGCAVGPEPYTVSILLRRAFGAALVGWDVSIVGTDINPDCVARAQAGRFSLWHLRSVSDETRRTCFVERGNELELREPYRQGVHFQVHNLVSDPPPGRFDLVLCRNVLIYFDLETVGQVIGRLRSGLGNGGWLVVGHAEPNLSLFRGFRSVNVPGAVLYQRADTAIERVVTPAAEMPRGWPAPAPSAAVDPVEVPPPALVRPPGGLAAEEEPPAQCLQSLMDAGAWQAAADAAVDLLAADRSDAITHSMLALALRQLGRPDDAVASARRALYLDRATPMAHYVAALGGLDLGRPEDARRSFGNARRALQLMRPEDNVPGCPGVTVARLDELMQLQLRALSESAQEER